MDNRFFVIQKALWDLNIPPTYLGTHYLAYAELLVLEDPNRLIMVTKWLYPEVASHYRTTWQAVERNIRTVIAVCWDNGTYTKIEKCCKTVLSSKPSPTGIIQLLAHYFFSQPEEFWRAVPNFPLNPASVG